MMRKFLSCLLSAILIFAYAPAIPAENHFDLSLEALPGAKPEVHVLPLPDKELPLIRALVGGNPVDALRLQGEEYRDLPAFYCLVLGETAQLRFADSDKPYLYVPVYELLKVAAEQQEKPLLIEIKAPAQAHLSMSGQMGMVDLGHLKEVPPDPADQESAIQEPNTGTGVTDKPAITQKPTDGQTPVVTKKPVITIKPVITKKPVITDKPEITDKPVITNKPVITEKPVITNKPVTSEDPNTITDPPQIDPCADGHNWGKPQPDTTSRKHTLVCQNNPAHTSQVDCDYVTEETPATCDGPGEKAYACSGCGDSYKEAIPAPGHNWGAWVSNKDGSHSRVCSIDSKHTEKTQCRYTDILTLPTCTEDGFTTHVCQDCGYTTTDAPTKATGHAWGAWVSNKDGT